jgi:Flp pilus assembly protein TadG
LTGRSWVRPRRGRPRTSGQGGQGLVEFAVLVPLFLVLLLAMLELGYAFNHQLTIQYATREGARIGADLVNGGGTLGCSAGQSPNRASVDEVIIEAADRILTSTGSPIPLAQVSKIRIFHADSSGKDTLSQDDDWSYSATLHTMSDGTQVNFVPGATSWQPCSRTNQVGHTYTNAVDSIGVAITYTYKLTTPLAGAMKLIGGNQAATIPMTDSTVMQLNPTN